MTDTESVVKNKSDSDTKKKLESEKFIQAIIFGFIFGFLLQKGGVAKYHILVGQLLVQDFTVIKVMMSAIVVGMVGVYFLNKLALTNLHLKPTRLGSNIIGGLIFGVGFALIGYCPGTGAAAIGQGNGDALFGVGGLLLGSYLFAELSGKIKETIGKWGDLGKITIPDLLKVPHGAVVLILCLFLLGFLFFVERTWP